MTLFWKTPFSLNFSVSKHSCWFPSTLYLFGGGGCHYAMLAIVCLLARRAVRSSPPPPFPLPLRWQNKGRTSRGWASSGPAPLTWTITCPHTEALGGAGSSFPVGLSLQYRRPRRRGRAERRLLLESYKQPSTKMFRSGVLGTICDSFSMAERG